ncbi:MAG: hypothetical protein PHT92_04725 [Bacteroidales bacterium]|nr:hypothetical protein [Bacteroidales bacterium]
MQPSRSTLDLTVQSLKNKKYKANKFAAGYSCEVIPKRAEMLAGNWNARWKKPFQPCRKWNGANQRESFQNS